jgi:hypothetical protein
MWTVRSYNHRCVRRVHIYADPVFRGRARPLPQDSSEATAKAVLIVLGVVLVVMGCVFTLQGLGYLAGSAMTGVTLWAIIGPILAVVGIVLIVLAARTGRPGHPG